MLSDIEFSTNYETHNVHLTRDIHIVGLMLDVNNTILRNMIEFQNTVIEKSIKSLFECLTKHGFNQISFENFLAQGNASNRWHLKQYLASASIRYR